MAADNFVGPKIEKEPGGDVIRIKSGGEVVVATGATFTNTAINRKYFGAAVPSGTAGVATGIRDQVFAPSAAVTVRAVTLIPSATCAGHATSNFTLALMNVGTGATGSTTIASLALTTGNALAANVPKAFTMATTASIAALEHAAYYHTLASSGIDYPPGELVIEFTVDN